MLPYILPFAVYIVLSLAGGYLAHGAYIMYPVKTVAVGVTLWYYRKHYVELRTRLTFRGALWALLVGVVVFVIWVLPEGLYPLLGESEFNPMQFEGAWLIYTMVGFRIAGAVLVVPLFEELFWRSFLIRWIVDQDFRKVGIGTFTWLSFALTVLFFGLEHHRWLVGLAAGAIYNALLYQQKNLWPCILAHAVTNLALAIYVLRTEQWGFW